MIFSLIPETRMEMKTSNPNAQLRLGGKEEEHQKYKDEKNRQLSCKMKERFWNKYDEECQRPKTEPAVLK